MVSYQNDSHYSNNASIDSDKEGSYLSLKSYVTSVPSHRPPVPPPVRDPARAQGRRGTGFRDRSTQSDTCCCLRAVPVAIISILLVLAIGAIIGLVVGK